MKTLSIQNWIKTKYRSNLFSTESDAMFVPDLSSYDTSIQSLQKPSEFVDLDTFINYCQDIQNQLHKEK